MTETGWLIEWFGHQKWWNGEGYGMQDFTSDSFRAVRFARKQDAEVVMDCTPWEFRTSLNLVVTEHQWESL